MQTPQQARKSELSYEIYADYLRYFTPTPLFPLFTVAARTLA